MFGMNIGRMGVARGASGSGFDIASLYAGGKKGMWYQPLDASTRFQDQAGTMPATIANPATGLLLDKSGNALPLRQATSTARPLFDARVNLLTKTEQFDDAAWGASSGITPTGMSILETNTNAPHFLRQGGQSAAALGKCVGRIQIKPSGRDRVQFFIEKTGSANFTGATFNLTTKTVINTFNNGDGVLQSATITDSTDGYLELTVVVDAPTNGVDGMLLCVLDDVANGGSIAPTYLGNSAKGILVRNAQVQSGTEATRYQRVNTSTDYDIAGFPQSLKYNGIDAGMGTAAFSAGTLGANMDIFIAVKRGVKPEGSIAFADSTHYIGAFATGAVPGSAPASLGSGTPTYFVNGVAVPGGVATTTGQLSAALPINTWCILELHNVDMSAWVGLADGNLSGKLLSGNLGSIPIFEAQTDAVRTQVRQTLAAEVGVVLP